MENPVNKVVDTTVSTATSDNSEKRKSVSFVDEKLIQDALKSATISNGKSTNGYHSNYSKVSNGDKRNGGYSNDSGFKGKHTNGFGKQYQKNGHQNGSFSNSNGKGYGKHQPNGHVTNGSANGYHRSTNKQQVATNKPVIIYYNDPQNTDIDVKNLLTKCQTGQQSDSTNVTANHSQPKPSKSPHPSGNQYTNGKYKNRNSTAPFKGSKQQYHQQPQNGGKLKDTKNNDKKVEHSKLPETKAAESNGRQWSAVPPSQAKCEPITIYYTAPNVSTVIEEKLKLLRENKLAPTKIAEAVDSGNGGGGEAVSVGHESADQTATNNKTEMQVDQQKSEPVLDSVSSQNNVIQIKSVGPVECDMPKAVTTSSANADQYDVISGGVLIPAPELPTETKQHHPVVCTLVSHPGHFYAKFVNERYEQELKNMTTFYNSEEPIELTLDVLKAGQYFAACRTANNETSDGQWIRVQLLHVENVDLINCLVVDEGCFGTFKISQLQPLYNQYRTVPKQAIRVALSGVKPKENDWLPKQALEFKSLVENGRLYTKFDEQFDQKTFDEQGFLEIELYFDDGEFKDKMVSDVLIEKDIALKK